MPPRACLARDKYEGPYVVGPRNGARVRVRSVCYCKSCVPAALNERKVEECFGFKISNVILKSCAR